MPPTLEGMLIALAMALTSVDAGIEREAALAAPRPPEACGTYLDPDRRRDCLARVGRAVTANTAPFPSSLHWVAPREPGMAIAMRLPNGLR